MNRPEFPEECTHYTGDSVICDCCHYSYQKELANYIEELEEEINNLRDKLNENLKRITE